MNVWAFHDLADIAPDIGYRKSFTQQSRAEHVADAELKRSVLQLTGDAFCECPAVPAICTNSFTMAFWARPKNLGRNQVCNAF